MFIYVTFASDVLLICWCGTQLTQHSKRKWIVVIVVDAVIILLL